MWAYLLLGILQGIFEWLPVSSEGVVALASQLMVGGINPVDVSLFLHLGTFFVVMVYFRKGWKEVATLKDPGLLRFLAITTVISLAIGLPVYLAVRSVATGVALLFVMGIGLLFTACFHRSGRATGMGLGRLAAIAGILQGFSVIPGLSRSGSTIFGLSLGDLKPSDVLRLSYMMSAPVILVSAAFVAISNPVVISAWPSLITSFIMGFASLHFLMRISQRMNFFWFALVFALLCFVGGGVGMIVL